MFILAEKCFFLTSNFSPFILAAKLSLSPLFLERAVSMIRSTENPVYFSGIDSFSR